MKCFGTAFPTLEPTLTIQEKIDYMTDFAPRLRVVGEMEEADNADKYLKDLQELRAEKGNGNGNGNGHAEDLDELSSVR